MKFLSRIRRGVEATVESCGALGISPKVLSRGVFCLMYNVGGYTLNIVTRIYAPCATGGYVTLFYQNHDRARMQFAERNSFLYAFEEGIDSTTSDGLLMSLEMLLNRPEAVFNPRELKKMGALCLFERDYDEFRRKSQTKITFATRDVVKRLGVHLFGREITISDRKVLGLLLRASGIGASGEGNRWAITEMRRRFAKGKDEADTDVEDRATWNDLADALGQ